MNYRKILIIFVMLLMVIFPAVVGILVKGQASPAESGDKPSKVNLTVYSVSSGVVTELDLEEYLTGVMLAEIPAVYGEEALKALAVCLRSLAVKRLSESDKLLKHFGAELCDDRGCCLGYISLEDAAGRWGEDAADVYYKTAALAVSQTRGEIVAYDGVAANALFHESSKGKTESCQNVWGIDVPYLRSAETPEEVASKDFSFTTEEFEERLKSNGVYADFFRPVESWIDMVEKNENGRVRRVFVCGRVLTGVRVAEIFGLPSAVFEMNNTKDGIVFTVWGQGNGVGLSIAGAEAYAKKNWDYKSILCHYFEGAEICTYKPSAQGK